MSFKEGSHSPADEAREKIRTAYAKLSPEQSVLQALNYETQNPHFFKGNQTRLTNSEFFVVSRLSHN